MKNYFIVCLLLFCASCNFKKVTSITLQNNNATPTAIFLKANNITHLVGPVAAGAKVESTMDWTNIQQKDGEFIIQVQDDKGNDLHTYTHGFFEKGELYNHIDMIVQGIEVKITIQN
jgi:hypothetical protein